MWSTPDLPLSKSADSSQKPQDGVFPGMDEFPVFATFHQVFACPREKKNVSQHLSDEIGVVLVSLYGVAAYVRITPLLFLYLMTFSQVSGHL